MTQQFDNINLTGTINSYNAGVQTVTLSGAINRNTPDQPTLYCFKCLRKDPAQFVWPATQYKGTLLCIPCAQEIPDPLLVSEWPS